MRDFARSLKYLRPYRVRIGLALLCTLAISVLWAGGLAAILPVTKVLMSSEGLHGWAYKLAASDRLGVDLAAHLPSDRTQLDGQQLSWVAEVRQVRDSRRGGGSLLPGEWVLGLEDGSDAHRLLRADALMRLLAIQQADQRITLRVYGPNRDQITPVPVVTGGLTLPNRALLWLARRFSEPQTYADRFPMLLVLLAFAIGVTLLRDALRVLQEFLSTSAVWYAVNDIRSDNYNVALRLPVSYYAKHGATDTMSRFIQDVGLLARGHITLLGKTLVEPAKALAALAIAMMLSWKLTLMAMIAGPPAFLAIRRLGRAMRRVSREALQSMSELLGVLEETLSGIRVVKAYTMENRQRRRFLRINRQVLRQNLKMFFLDALTGPVVEVLGITAAMAAVAVAGYWVLHSQPGLDAEKFLALMACLVAMFDPIRKLSAVSTVFHASDAAAARIMELHDTPQEVVVPHAPSLPRHRRSIEFRSVSFRYDGTCVDALRDVNLVIQAGENVALVGPNGSGKTTLVSMIPRLLDPTAGQVLIDGMDISQCALRSLRRQIGLVTQDVVLFHATIEENISYGLHRSRPDKTRHAAQRAHADEFVRKLPGGYGTMVGPHGATLSGGEKQQVAIARAILRDPAILIFDEAMSQIDADSEHRIQQAMQEFSRGRTTLVVAHRFATVLAADRIVVMQAGQIQDTGPHGELMNRCALYRHLYNTQFTATGGDARATTAPAGPGEDAAK
ncbi:MAG: ABC transporter ATP-binding protein/permease [Phycisphaerae bacterium]|nr:ABC transporter ATP-binding protein/permease [Phycisphaerae bacterium]